MATINAKIIVTKVEVKAALEAYLRSNVGMKIVVYDFSLDPTSLNMEVDAKLEREPSYSER